MRQLRQQVNAHFSDDVFPRLTTATAAAFGLRLHDGIEHLSRLGLSELQISIEIKPEDLRAVDIWQVIFDSISVNIDIITGWNGIAFMKRISHHQARLCEKLFGEGIHLSPVPVVGDPATVLDL
eukprot:CAMPEP_0179451022 /NCGR_PEP_ID=MMETSP0799-20121207/35079_1 /TAXON_ID=46947 /ORGANISM="Geminigera cryophila, Strain CCMP2564" /LENGTH=123 /DNA_ID=CAMNT_0021245871 /DNA_START=881 /DNA_END=1252 /DNA_ORIENTATION=+